MFELVEVKTGRIMGRYGYDFDEFIQTKYGGFFSLITDDAFTPGDVMPEFAWRRRNIGIRKEVRETMTKQEGEFCNKRCPKCGAMLLKNERGDEWCSRLGCEYLSKELHEKEK
jgi:hypothetical protein